VSSNKTKVSGARPGRPRGENFGEATKTLDRGLNLLELIGGDELTLSEIARRAELHPSTTSRLVRTLSQRGFLSYDEQQGLYRIGSRLLNLAGNTPPAQLLIDKSRKLLEKVQAEFDETVNLSVREGTHIVYLDSIPSSQPLRMFTEIGARIPLHATGGGKALLTGLSDRQITDIFAGITLEKFTPQTLTDVESLIAEVRKCEERGYAFDIEERQAGVVCVAAAANFADLPRAAISISGPRDRLSGERLSEIGKKIADFARSAPAG